MSAQTMTTTTRIFSPSWFSRRRRRKATTFWSKLCAECRQQSCDTTVERVWEEEKGWDVGGPAMWHWNDILGPVIQEYFERNKRGVLDQNGWLASIDCWMIGREPTNAKPTVIVTCSETAVATRLNDLIELDLRVRNSGFKFASRKGMVIVTMDTVTPESPSAETVRNLKLYSGPTSQRPQIGDGLSILSANFESLGRRATLGGQIVVKNRLWNLTAAHVFLRDPLRNKAVSEPDDGSDTLLLSEGFDLKEKSCDEVNEMGDARFQSVPTDMHASGLRFGTESQERFVRHPRIHCQGSDSGLSHELAPQMSPPCSIAGDWALLQPVHRQVHLANQFDDDGGMGKHGCIRQAERLEETKYVTVLATDLRWKRSATCRASASLSLVCLPGSSMLQKAQALLIDCGNGDSGAWVVDWETETWYGTLVACQKYDRTQGYMLPAPDTLEGIRNRHGGYVGLPTWTCFRCGHVTDVLAPLEAHIVDNKTCERCGSFRAAALEKVHPSRGTQPQPRQTFLAEAPAAG